MHTRIHVHHALRCHTCQGLHRHYTLTILKSIIPAAYLPGLGICLCAHALHLDQACRALPVPGNRLGQTLRARACAASLVSMSLVSMHSLSSQHVASCKLGMDSFVGKCAVVFSPKEAAC